MFTISKFLEIDVNVYSWLVVFVIVVCAELERASIKKLYLKKNCWACKKEKRREGGRQGTYPLKSRFFVRTPFLPIRDETTSTAPITM